MYLRICLRSSHPTWFEPGVGELLLGLATSYLKLNQFHDAAIVAQLARDILKMRDGKHSMNHALSLNVLAGVHLMIYLIIYIY